MVYLPRKEVAWAKANYFMVRPFLSLGCNNVLHPNFRLCSGFSTSSIKTSKRKYDTYM